LVAALINLRWLVYILNSENTTRKQCINKCKKRNNHIFEWTKKHGIWKKNLKPCCSSIPHTISTKRTITSHLNWTHWTQKQPRDMTLEIYTYFIRRIDGKLEWMSNTPIWEIQIISLLFMAFEYLYFVMFNRFNL
jgi:hypothetical protein